MAVETIKEFLISIGYRQDEAALRKFEQGIGDATKAVFTLAAAIEATAITVAAGVARFASNLEALYFASIRTHSAVVNLKALDLAAQNFGASSGEAVASLEELAHILRTAPGKEGFLAGFGVQLKDAKGKARDLTDVMIDFGKAMQNKGYTGDRFFVAAQLGNQLGISERTMLALINGDFSRELSRVRAEISGTNWQKTAADAHTFEVQLRDLITVLEAFGARVEDALMKKLGTNLKQVLDWLSDPKHADKLATWITNAATTIENASDIIVTAVKDVITVYEKLLAAATKVGQWFADNAPTSMVDYLGFSISEMLHSLGLISDEDAKRNENYYNQSRGADAAINNPGNLEFHGQPGATHTGRFAQFGTMQQGLDALANQLFLYGKRGINTVQGIESAYSPANENDTAALIERMSKTLGVKSTERLSLGDPQVLARVMNAIADQEGNNAGLTSEMVHQAAMNVTRAHSSRSLYDDLYPVPADRGAIARSGSPTLNQKTDIHVNGAGNPAEVAARVAEAQRRTNQDLTRDFVTVVQ